jgi:hypothetical protein
MPYLALLLLIAVTPSVQNGSQSVSQPNKSSNPGQDAGHKKKVSPPTAPVTTQSETCQPTLQYNQTYSEESAKAVHDDWKSFLNAISTTVVAVFTVLMVAVYWSQLQATKTAERAWIVDLPPGLPTRNPDGDTEIRWQLENRGRTPAWVTSLGSAAQIVAAGGPPPAIPPYTMSGPFPPQGTVLTPNGKIERGLTIPFANMTAVEAGTHALYVFGIAEYRDIFGSKHETRYCYRFKPGPTPADPAPRDFYVNGPPSYNRAT